jgi:hypothetical protein
MWDEYIGAKGTGRLREMEAVGGRRSALDWSWFQRLFTPDCTLGRAIGPQASRSSSKLLLQAWALFT